MLTSDMLRSKFALATPYEAYIATGTPPQQASWKRIHDQAALTDAQRRLVGSFTRAMPVLVVSGVWCGDCVQQCPLLERIAEANRGRIDLRFLDRDEHMDLADRVRICGGHRVPTVIFMAEDHEFVALAGDRTLSRYRALAERHLGPSCPLPGAPVADEELAATLQDWADEFERVHLILRLSGRLRQRHGD